MGAGVSSLVRLRKALVIRAFNLRDKDQTLEEQFEQYTFTKKDDDEATETNPKVYISLDDVRNVMNDNGKLKWIDDLFRQLLGTSNCIDMEFQDFIDFLETGKSPSTVVPVSSSSSSSPLKMSKKKKALKDAVAANVNVTNNVSPPFSVFPGKPTIQSQQLQDEQQVPIINLSTSSSAPSLSALLERNKIVEEEEQRKRKQLQHPPKPPNQSPSSSSSSPSSSSTKGNSTSGVYPEVIETIEYILANTDKYALITMKKGNGEESMVPPKPLWRKREVVRQEKSVYYTTVDVDGITQELMEKETTQTEILHMECKETGEFAHRETTNHELLEKFNDEVVTHDTGKEEYVHLKSLDDEIEYMDSNMPSKSNNDSGEEAKNEQTGDSNDTYDYAYASKQQQEEALGADTASNTNDEKEGFPVHNNNNNDDQYYNKGRTKAKTVEKLDVDEADVEEEMKRQWDMLSDEEKAYYEEAILQMEKEREAEMSAHGQEHELQQQQQQQQQQNQEGDHVVNDSNNNNHHHHDSNSPESPSSVVPPQNVDIEEEEDEEEEESGVEVSGNGVALSLEKPEINVLSSNQTEEQVKTDFADID